MTRKQPSEGVIQALSAFSDDEIVQVAERTIAERLPELVECLLDLALGVKIFEQKLVDGEIVRGTYTRPPDFKAAQYLTERILGKTPQRHEITGKGGGAIQIIPMMLRERAIDEGLIIEGEARVLPGPGEERPDV